MRGTPGTKNQGVMSKVVFNGLLIVSKAPLNQASHAIVALLAHVLQAKNKSTPPRQATCNFWSKLWGCHKRSHNGLEIRSAFENQRFSLEILRGDQCRGAKLGLFGAKNGDKKKLYIMVFRQCRANLHKNWPTGPPGNALQASICLLD